MDSSEADTGKVKTSSMGSGKKQNKSRGQRRPVATSQRPSRAQSRTSPVRPAEPRFLDRLGFVLRNDLDPIGMGLSWMGGDTATRILLSDHLVGTLDTLGQNITASNYHLTGFERANTTIDSLTLKHWQQSLRKGTRPHAIAPASSKREESLCARDSHVAGFFRAIGSQLDNAAVVVSVIGALPVDVVEMFTWGTLRRTFEGRQSNTFVWEQEALRAWIKLAQETAGPRGWLEWSLSMRNMLVHRPRRVWTQRVVPSPENGFPVRLRTSLMLPREPELATVEVMRDGAGLNESLLREDAFVTMSGVLESTSRFTEAICAYLISLVDSRRRDPALLVQPPEQWRGKSVLPKIRLDRFEGYRPQSVHPLQTGDSLNTNDPLTRRLTAAAVFDGQRDQWPEWLAAAQLARGR